MDLTTNKVKDYLKNLGFDMNKYNGYYTTDVRHIAKIDSTIVHISHDFTKHRAYVYQQ